MQFVGQGAIDENIPSLFIEERSDEVPIRLMDCYVSGRSNLRVQGPRLLRPSPGRTRNDRYSLFGVGTERESVRGGIGCDETM